MRILYSLRGRYGSSSLSIPTSMRRIDDVHTAFFKEVVLTTSATALGAVHANNDPG